MKKRTKIKQVSFIALICLCSGCVGVSVTGDKSAVVNNPNISKNKGYIGHTPLAPNRLVAESEVVKYWGSPDKVEVNDKGQKQLLYKRDEFRWNGITLMMVVPIPLVVPVGHDYLSLTVDNGSVTSAYMKNNSGESGFYCWIAPLFHPADWCRAPSSVGVVESVPLHEFTASDESLINK